MLFPGVITDSTPNHHSIDMAVRLDLSQLEHLWSWHWMYFLPGQHTHTLHHFTTGRIAYLVNWISSKVWDQCSKRHWIELLILLNTTRPAATSNIFPCMGFGRIPQRIFGSMYVHPCSHLHGHRYIHILYIYILYIYKYILYIYKYILYIYIVYIYIVYIYIVYIYIFNIYYTIYIFDLIYNIY